MNLSSRFNQVDAFILHARPYQESSAILDVFSREEGRISILAKGIRRKNSQAKKAILQPFRRLNLSYTGKSDLKTLTECDLRAKQQIFLSTNERLACGYYFNELLQRALPEWESFPEVYDHYASSLEALNITKAEIVLRSFEVALLTSLGLAPDWQVDSADAPINEDLNYRFIENEGFQVSESCGEYAAELEPLYSGATILSLAKGAYAPESLKSCQHLTQRLLRQVIGSKPLQSRKLWQHSRQSDSNTKN